VARGRLRVNRAALVEALTGQLSDHHARLARILLDQIDGLTTQLDQLTTLIEEAIAAIPTAQAPAGGAEPGPTGGAGAPAQGPLPAVQRLDEVPGIGPKAAQVIIAEVGLDMGQFPTPGHLVSWAKIAPQTIQAGATHRAGPTGKGNPYLRGTLGEVAAAAAKTDTFLGERDRRLVRRRGKLKALVAIARSILVIVWHLLADPPPASATWAPTTTPAASTPAARPAAWSASSRPSATPSPCNPPHRPDRPRPTTSHHPPPGCPAPGAAACPLRWSFSGQVSSPCVDAAGLMMSALVPVTRPTTRVTVSVESLPSEAPDGGVDG
jgi:Transposase IS116/IS110/IS902 family